MRVRLLLVLGCVTLALGAAPAGAAPPLRDVGQAADDDGRPLLAADGQRVAYALPGDRVRVIDGEAREVASVPSPADCSWVDFGGGSLLWVCGGVPLGDFHGVLYDVDTRVVTQLPPPALPNETARASAPAWWEVGRHWLGVYYISDDVGLAQYVNRTTGEVVPASTIYASRDRRDRRVPDLDRVDLMRPLCRPLLPRWRPAGRAASHPAAFSYQRPFGATLSETRGETRLLVGRCGARRVTVVALSTGLQRTGGRRPGGGVAGRDVLTLAADGRALEGPDA